MADAAAGTGLPAPWAPLAIRRKPWVDSALLMLASVVIFLINTHQGIGVEPDTTRYMRLGPESYDAPLYPWILDAIRFSGLSFQSGAKAFALLLVTANTWLIWRMLLLGSASAAYAAAGTLLITLSPQFVGLHAVAMSEAPFLATLLLTVFAFLRYVASRRMAWLIGCGVLIGTAMLARFTAAPLALALASILIIRSGQPATRRLGEIIVLAAVSGAIFFGWVIGSKLTGGQGIGRELAFNGSLDLDMWRGLLSGMTTYLLPSAIPLPIRTAVLLAVIGPLVWLIVKQGRAIFGQLRNAEPSADRLIPLIWAIFAAFYVSLLILSVAIEANLTFDGRYLLPLYVALVITGVCAVSSRTAGRSAELLGWILAGLAALILASHATRTAAMTRTNNLAGIGYTSTGWRASPIIGAVKHLPRDAVIFSNAPDALNYLTGRKTSFTPFRFQRRTGREDPANRASDVLKRIRQRLAAGNGYLVFIDRVDWRFYAMPESEVVGALSPPLIQRTVDGRIYGPYRAPRLLGSPSCTTAKCGDTR